MKLTFEILNSYLQFARKPIFFKDDLLSLTFSRPVFLTDQSILKSGVLYISYTDRLNNVNRTEKGSALICIGDPPATVRKKLLGIMVYEPSCDILELANAVNRVYDYFDQWEARLSYDQGSGQTEYSFKNMLECSSDIFENGISVMDSRYRILYENEVNIKYGGYDTSSLTDGSSMSSEIINYFKFHKEYQDIAKSRDVFIYDGDILPHRCLCKNIFQNDRFLFRIVLTECLRPFRKSDSQLLEYLADIIQSRIAETQIYSSADQPFSNLITEALDTGKLNRQAFESELRKRNWSGHNTYRIISIHPSQEDFFISTLDYFCREIMSRFPYSYALHYQDLIIIIINETLAENHLPYLDWLSVFVRENNFRVGISNPNEDLYNLQILFRQAQIALSIGVVERPMEWIHYFSQFTLSYIFNLISNSQDLGDLYSPVYFRLLKHDHQNGTSYLETLRVYLECGSNAVQAASALFIQRSTMIYRLKRIREIGQCTLTDSDELLHLYLTFRLLQYNSR